MNKIIVFLVNLKYVSHIFKMSMWNYYYANPKTLYERYINKKWVERTDVQQTKEAFIQQENTKWKEIPELERVAFMSAPPPKKRRRINNYFTKIVS